MTITGFFPIRFSVPGTPQRFIAAWHKSSWSTRRMYADKAKLVRECAAVVGASGLVATEELPLYVHTRAFFRNRRHADPENIHKFIVDALMYGKSQARDKFTGGAFTPPRYDEDDPRVEVVIADGRLPLRETIPEDW